MIHIIVNPAGAAGRTVKFFRRSVLPLFSGADYTIHFSSRTQGISEIVSKLTDPSVIPEGSFVNLAVVGGDGTMNEVLNGIRDFEHTRVGLIPAGSGNDLARDLCLPPELEDIVARIRLEQTFRQIDVGETVFLDRDYTMRFVTGSGFGFDAHVCHLVETAPLKSILNRLRIGKLVYLIEAIRLIFLWKNVPVTVTYGPRGDEGEHTRRMDRFMFLAAMNHRFEGGGFMISPNASDTDGKLDICTVYNVSKLKFLQVFPKALKGKHIQHKECVSMARRTWVRVQCDTPQWVHCDGEPKYDSQDVRMQIADVKLNLMV